MMDIEQMRVGLIKNQQLNWVFSIVIVSTIRTGNLIWAMNYFVQYARISCGNPFVVKLVKMPFVHVVSRHGH